MTPTLTEAVTAYKQTLVGKSPYTTANYVTALNHFAAYAKPSSHTDELNEDVLEQFAMHLLRKFGRERHSTVRTYMAGVSAFVAFLDRKHWLRPGVSYESIRANLREILGKPVYKSPRVNYDIARIVVYSEHLPLPLDKSERLEALRNRAILTTLYTTALRRQELCALNRADVIMGRTEVLITGKGGKERVIFFDDYSLNAIAQYLNERNDTYRPLFIRHDVARGEPGRGGENWRLAPQAIWRVVVALGEACGVKVTPHDLRHLKACVLLNNGAQLSEVQDILGHSSPETTKKVYAAYTTRHLREAFDKYSQPAASLIRLVGAR